MASSNTGRGYDMHAQQVESHGHEHEMLKQSPLNMIAVTP